MKVGISTATFFSKLLTEDSFSVIQQCGGECAEVFLTTYSEYEPSFGDLLRRRQEGLEVYSVHSLNTEFEPQLFNVADRTRLDAEEMYKKVLAVGKKLGAKCYTFHGPTRLKKTTVVDPEKVGRRMKILGDIALDYGITLCFENVHWAAFNSPEFFAQAKEFAPNIGAVLDVKQAWQSGRSWEEYVSVMGDRILNVHLCDHDGACNCMVGKGEYPFEDLIKRLESDDYAGPVLIEQYATNYNAFSEIAESVQYLKSLIGGIYADKIRL